MSLLARDVRRFRKSTTLTPLAPCGEAPSDRVANIFHSLIPSLKGVQGVPTQRPQFSRSLTTDITSISPQSLSDHGGAGEERRPWRAYEEMANAEEESKDVNRTRM